MNKQKRNIHWEPYNLDNYGIDDEDELREGEELDFEEEVVLKKLKKIPRIITTPFGPYRVDDSSNPLRRFQFLIGHTNFRIGRRAYNILDYMPGVEALIVTTPYRFIIAVAQMFNVTDVKINIERELCGKHMVDAYLSEINDEKTLEEAKECLASVRTSKYWTIYIVPNGYIHSYKTENRQEFINQYNVFSEARELSNGILITSEDDYGNTPNNKVQHQ